MELKKIIILLVVLSLADTFYAQYFDMESFSLEDERLKIEEESVVFSAATLTATIKINNTSNENVTIKPTIKCIPLPYGGGSYSLTLIPDDFQMFDNDRKMSFLISYQNRYIQLRIRKKNRHMSQATYIFHYNLPHMNLKQ